MENKKYNYTIRWKQTYRNWIPSREWLDAADVAILEGKLEQQGLGQAQEVIERIKNL